MFGNTKLDVDQGIAEFLLADEINALSPGAVDDNAFARGDDEVFGVGWIKGNVLCGHPFAGWLSPGGEIGQIDLLVSSGAGRDRGEWQQKGAEKESE